MSGFKWLGIKWGVFLAATMSAVAAPTSRPAGNAFSSNDSGLIIDAGTIARLVLEYPKLLNSDGKVIHKLVDKKRFGAEATLSYEGGAEVRLQAKADGVLSISFANIPTDAK